MPSLYVGKAKTLCSLKNTLEGDGEDREKGKKNIYIALRRGRQDGHQSGCNGLMGCHDIESRG